MPPRLLLCSVFTLTACWPFAKPRVHGEPPTAEISAAATGETPGGAGRVLALRPAVADEGSTAADDRDVAVAVAPPEPDEDIDPGSWRFAGFATVRAEPRLDAVELGVIAPGTRVARRKRSKDRACLSGWVEVEPAGFVCAKLIHDKRAPSDALLPLIPRGSVVPGVYGKIRSSGAELFSSVDELRRGEGRATEASLTVRRLGTKTVDGKSYWKTRHGLVAASSVRRYRGSRFEGVDLTSSDGPSLPVAWALRSKDRFTAPVRAEPSARAKISGRVKAKRRFAVEAISEDGAFVNIGEGQWMARKSVRIAEVSEPPAGVEAGERWLDIDLDEQTLVAYQGETPVYATLISSGKVLHRTPTGVYRIERKVAMRTMNSMADSTEEYSVDKVPWTAYFAHGYALHAAYWHGGFGRTRSHGCVNLSPIDARHLYAWMAPSVAPGWVEAYGHSSMPGSVVRIRNRKDPEPKWRGYAAKLAPAADASLHG